MSAPLLTLREVAQRLRMSERWVEIRVQRGELKRVKLGRATRFHPADVDRFMRSLAKTSHLTPTA